MLQRLCLAASGVALATAMALWPWQPVNDGAMSRSGGAMPAQRGALPVAAAVAVDERSRPAPVLAAPLPRPAGTAAAVPITVTAVQKLRVGEMSDLILGLGPTAGHAGVSEISFSVQFDPNVLQVRAATEGGWAAGAGVDTRFASEISSAEDRVQVRAGVSGRRLNGEGGSVALVQFQAVAPGTTSVIVSDVVVKDWAGRSTPFALAASNLQVTAESIPPALP